MDTVTKAAVIVATYNHPDSVRATLDGYLAQDTDRFEVIMADDGSGEETVALIKDYARRAPFALKHVWQEDRGFRAAAARNRALALTDAEYVIYTDGDCVPPPFFVSRHVALAERGCFLAGNRVLLSEGFTKKVLAERLPIHEWSTGRWLRAWLARDVNRALPLLLRPDAPWRKATPQRWEGIKTCNFSAWRSDLAAVNGFDETYSGWGMEDSDLVIRLLHAGVRHKSARFAAPVFHLWHREADRSGLARNRAKIDELLASDRVAALEGLDRHT